MSGKTMSDWEKLARKILGDEKYANSIHTEKKEDLAMLAKSGLPQYDWFSVPYLDFSLKNEGLSEFLNKHISQGEGFVVRAIPNSEGFKKEYIRKFKIGVKNYEECRTFLDEVIKQDFELFSVEMTSWEPQIYGGVIIAGRDVVRGEIAHKLDKLTAGEENSLASFEYDSRWKVGHIENKTRWLVQEDKRAKEILWRVFRTYITKFDSFNPFILIGYYEFAFTEKCRVRFLDFKLNKMYMK